MKELLDELSRKYLNKYIKSARVDKHNKEKEISNSFFPPKDALQKDVRKRSLGIHLAHSRLIELSSNMMDRYIDKAKVDKENIDKQRDKLEDQRSDIDYSLSYDEREKKRKAADSQIKNNDRKSFNRFEGIWKAKSKLNKD